MLPRARSFNTASLAERERNTTYNPGLDPPTLFGFNTTPSGVNGYNNLLPAFTFGGDLPNTVAYGATGGVSGTDNYFNANTIWTFEDNVSKVVGNHQFKTGVYYETNRKLQPAGNLFSGSFNFGTDANNPLDSGDGLPTHCWGTSTHTPSRARVPYSMSPIRTWSSTFRTTGA
jgi:hypothetical protein